MISSAARPFSKNSIIINIEALLNLTRRKEDK